MGRTTQLRHAWVTGPARLAPCLLSFALACSFSPAAPGGTGDGDGGATVADGATPDDRPDGAGPGPIDAASGPIDAGVGGDCESLCDGECDRGVCVFRCESGGGGDDDDGDGGAACPDQIQCPPGIPCRVECRDADSCAGGVDCTQSSSCEVRCDGQRSCGGPIQCGAGECRIECRHDETCQGGIECGDSCYCEVDCSGSSSCEPEAVCPAGCDQARNCRTNGPCQWDC